MRESRLLSIGRLACLIFFACVLTGGTALADSLIGYFNLDVSLNPIPAVGQVTFSLNADGTIAATLIGYDSHNLVGFGYNSLLPNLPESGFFPTLPDNPYGWGDAFGTQPSGFLCTACGTMESFTIGNPGDYTSVWQVLGGGPQSTVDFFLLSGGNQYGGDALSTTVPEPASVLLLGAGVLSAAALFRRKRVN